MITQGNPLTTLICIICIDHLTLQLHKSIQIIAIAYKLSNKMQEQMQARLMREFPVLRDKNKLIRYYVAFQFPDKQQQLVMWWKSIIQFVVDHSRQLFITPNYLKQIFSIHGLKPIPLQNILPYLEEKNDVIWDRAPTPKKSLISEILSHVFEPQKKSILDDKSNLTTSPHYDRMTQKSLQIIKKTFSKTNCFEYDSIAELISRELDISSKVVNQILMELDKKEKLIIEEGNHEKLILYSRSSEQMKGPNFKDVEKSKYLLIIKIDTFSRNIEKLYKEEGKILERARQEIEAGNSKNIKEKYLINANQKKKKRQALEIRKQILQKTLFDLENQQTNNVTIDLMSTCNQLLKKNAKDPSQIDEIIFKNKQITENQRQINQGIRQMAGQDDEEEALNLLEELQGEISKEKSQKVERLSDKNRVTFKDIKLPQINQQKQETNFLFN